MTRKPRLDASKTITDLFIAKLEAGTKPWVRPWAGSANRPLRHNGVAYTGINTLYLWAIADACGFQSPYWMTCKQANDLGAQIRKGERSAISVYSSMGRGVATDRVTGETTATSFRFMRAYSVFNADQIDGLPAHFYNRINTPMVTPTEKRRHVKAFFDAIPAAIEYRGTSAYYAPAPDKIVMPPAHLFKSPDHFASVKLHEIGHWSGAPHRLNRTFGKRYGDDAYAAEELVAEIVSGLAGAELGLPAELLDNHASYLDHWLRIMRADKTAIIKAASKAEQALQFLKSFGNRPETADVPLAA
jgi:antirestriction protein ArdC